MMPWNVKPVARVLIVYPPPPSSKKQATFAFPRFHLVETGYPLTVSSSAIVPSAETRYGSHIRDLYDSKLFF